MKTPKKLIILSLCLTILAVKTAFADDVPDQTIAIWSANYTEVLGDDMNDKTKMKDDYSLSISGGKLVIKKSESINGGDATKETLQILVSKKIYITEEKDVAGLNKDYYGIYLQCNEADFSANPPDTDQHGTTEIKFSKSDSATFNLVKEKLHNLTGN